MSRIGLSNAMNRVTGVPSMVVYFLCDKFQFFPFYSKIILNLFLFGGAAAAASNGLGTAAAAVMRNNSGEADMHVRGKPVVGFQFVQKT